MPTPKQSESWEGELRKSGLVCEIGDYCACDENHQEKLTSFIYSLLAAQRKEIKTDLLKIADEGEYEDLRREVERYFV